MKIPAQQLIHGLYRRTGKDIEQNYKSDEEKIYWNILLKSQGDINIDVNVLVMLYKKFKSSSIVTIVYLYASSSEINAFTKMTAELLSDDELNKLNQALRNRQYTQQY